MSPELASALTEILTPVLTALAVAVGGWIVSKLPGPVREALQANIHAKDVAVLVGAMQRRAMAEVADPRTPQPTAADVVAYIERIRPDLLTKLQVQPEALETMAQAAIATATVAATAPVIVAPPDVLIPPER